MFNELTTYFDECDAELVARFTAFIEKVVTNAKIDYLRKTSYAKHELPMDKLPDELEPQCTNDEELFKNEGFLFEEKRIADAFTELNLMRQKILEMTYIDELSAFEIAARLNCSAKYVYNQRAVAIKKLRDLLLRGGDKND